MPLNLPAINAAIVCNGKELEAYNVKQEGISALTAFITSEAGKEFKITVSNNLTNSEVKIILFIDGRRIRSTYVYAGRIKEFLGLYTGNHSIRPFKFQELQLVDPDLEDATIAPEMGTIELKAYRCQSRRTKRQSNQFTNTGNLHCGRVSERSKKAGWHHVITGDDIPVRKCFYSVDITYLDSLGGPPYASIKIFYRPRELLRAQGIIPANDVGRQASPIKNKKRAREDGSLGPSRSHPKIAVKSEELSEDAAT